MMFTGTSDEHRDKVLLTGLSDEHRDNAMMFREISGEYGNSSKFYTLYKLNTQFRKLKLKMIIDFL